MTKEVERFIMDNKIKYLTFLSQIKGFPFVCDISSSIMTIYLAKRFGINVSYENGHYDGEEHYWIKLSENTIIDFVEFQFDNELMKLCQGDIYDTPLSLALKVLPNNYPLIYKGESSYKKYELFESLEIDNFTIEYLGNLNNYDFDYFLCSAKELLINKDYIKK